MYVDQQDGDRSWIERGVFENWTNSTTIPAHSTSCVTFEVWHDAPVGSPSEVPDDLTLDFNVFRDQRLTPQLRCPSPTAPGNRHAPGWHTTACVVHRTRSAVQGQTGPPQPPTPHALRSGHRAKEPPSRILKSRRCSSPPRPSSSAPPCSYPVRRVLPAARRGWLPVQAGPGPGNSHLDGRCRGSRPARALVAADQCVSGRFATASTASPARPRASSSAEGSSSGERQGSKAP